MAGRTPKPSAMKDLQGTARPDRTNPAEPKPTASTEVPGAPSWLDEIGQEFFARVGLHLVAMQVMSAADWEAFAQVADAFAEYRAARAVTAKKGLTYGTRTQTGAVMRRKRPEVAIASEAWRRVQRGLAEFGLTPSSRTRVQVVPSNSSDPLDDFLNEL